MGTGTIEWVDDWSEYVFFFFFIMFFFNDTATTEIYTLSLHDALPILCFVKNFAAQQFVQLDGFTVRFLTHIYSFLFSSLQSHPSFSFPLPSSFSFLFLSLLSFSFLSLSSLFL